MCFRETCTHVLVYVLQRETYAVFIDIDLCKDAVSKINLDDPKLANAILVNEHV